MMLTGSGQHSSHFFEAFFEAADDACCVVATAPESSGQGAFQLLRANASFQEFVASRRVPPVTSIGCWPARAGPNW